ncbi:Probable 2-isopropylmalate synthase (LeuA) [Mycobacteroides abscessus subsp. abscessus]|nr:Probable 2-isopropylmalate synthase (LeuA) [Mycobacteroides abscessus subsp. abscessus]
MTSFSSDEFNYTPRSVVTPNGPIPADQPAWNTQKNSSSCRTAPGPTR